jgi:hypothetical protein
MSPRGTPLTDAQYAAIAWADPRESTAALSRRLGVDHETVRVNRQRIAQAGGWWCELVVRICPECDQPLLAAARQSGANQRRSHAACQRAKIARGSRDHHRRLAQHRLQQRTFAIMQETYQRDLSQTGPYAFRDHVPWTPDEDARLRAEAGKPAPALAVELGRSAPSVRMRRSRLRRQSADA